KSFTRTPVRKFRRPLRCRTVSARTKETTPSCVNGKTDGQKRLSLPNRKTDTYLATRKRERNPLPIQTAFDDCLFPLQEPQQRIDASPELTVLFCRTAAFYIRLES